MAKKTVRLAQLNTGQLCAKLADAGIEPVSIEGSGLLGKALSAGVVAYTEAELDEQGKARLDLLDKRIAALGAALESEKAKAQKAWQQAIVAAGQLDVSEFQTALAQANNNLAAVLDEKQGKHDKAAEPLLTEKNALINVKILAAEKACFVALGAKPETGEKRTLPARHPIKAIFSLRPLAGCPSMVWDGETLYVQNGKAKPLKASFVISSRSALNKITWLLAGYVRQGKTPREAFSRALAVVEKGNVSSIDCKLGVAGITDLESLPEWTKDAETVKPHKRTEAKAKASK